MADDLARGDEPTTPSSEADLPPELVEAETDEDRAEPEELDSEDLEPAELEPAGVGASVAGGSTARTASRKPGPQPKGTPTAKRDTVAAAEKRTTPAAFARQSVGELRKVVYPTGQQLGNYFVVVLVFVLFIIAIVSLLDLGLGKLVFAIFS